MSANYDGFETRFRSECCEKTGIAFADSETGREGVGGSGRFDSIVEEGHDVVGDVEVEPGEDCAGFVG